MARKKSIFSFNLTKKQKSTLKKAGVVVGVLALVGASAEIAKKYKK